MFFRKSSPAPEKVDGDTPSPHRARLGKRIAAKLRRNPLVVRAENDQLDLYLRADFVSPEECAAMRALIDADARPSTLFSGTANPEYRTSYSCHLDRYDPLVSSLSARIDSIMNADDETAETLQGQRYTSGQQYQLHCDTFPVNSSYWPEMRAQGGQRCWTAMLYLSDVEAGGQTSFPRAGLMVAPAAGTLVLWNNLREDGSPNPFTLHAALPVETGVKYVATRWYREHSWLNS